MVDMDIKLSKFLLIAEVGLIGRPAMAIVAGRTYESMTALRQSQDISQVTMDRLFSYARSCTGNQACE